MDLQVRDARDSDRKEIVDLVLAAFGEAEGPEIAHLTTELLEDPGAYPLWSLVGVTGGSIVGYVLFTRTRIKPSGNGVSSAILAPLAVHPAHQRRGIGAQLIAEGLNQLKVAGVDLVFVFGDSGYYSRHGFSAAGIRGFHAPYPIPAEHADAWMVKELHPGIVGHVAGQVICADVLNDSRYW